MYSLDALMKRKSVRKFLNKPVEQDKIKTILDAGFAAPSALNKRPYHFIVVDDRALLDELSLNSRGKKVLLGAPLAIVVVADPNINPQMEFMQNDGSACIENMLIAIEALDLGGCWLGQKRVDDEGMNKALHLPDGMFVIGTIALGYPDEDKIQPNRYDQSKIHHNTW